MREPHSILQNGRKSIIFKSLTIMVATFILLIIGAKAGSLSATEAGKTKNQLNLSGNMQIVVTEDLLSVSLKDVDLKEILKEISRQSNIEINFKDTIKERVTLQFVNLPLESGLKRLLKNQSYSFIYSKKKDTAVKDTPYVLRRVFLLAKPTSSQEVHVNPPNQAMSSNEISAEKIREILDEEFLVQGKDLKAFSETMNSRLKQVVPQLKERLEQIRNNENQDLGPEAFSELVRELEASKLKPVVPK